MTRAGPQWKRPFVAPEEVREKVVRRYVEVVALALNLIPLLVLVGWQFNLAFLKSLSPGFAAMNPGAAVSFIVIGWALLLRLRGGFWRFVGAGLAVPVGILGLDRLYAYATH